MKPTWILVANAAEARLFQQEGGGPLAIREVFLHPASRQRSSELGPDKAGRELSGRGFGGAAFEPRLDAHEKERLHFARELAQHLEQGAQHGLYDALTVFAASPFLGELKREFGSATQRLLAGTHDLDLSRVGPEEIDGRIRQELARAD